MRRTPNPPAARRGGRIRAASGAAAGPLLLAALVALLAALPSVATAASGAAPREPTVAIAAVPTDPRVTAAIAGRFGTVLATELSSAGFPLLDVRQADLRLAERPDLLAGCQRDSQREACLEGQAQYLGVARIILPRLQPMEMGLGIALTLFEISPGRIERLVEAVELCQPCQAAQLRTAVGRVARALRQGLERALAGQVEILATAPEARLYADGRDVGQGRAVVELAPGEHVIAAQGPGGRSEQRVVLGPREQQRVELALASVPEPAPAPLRRTSGPRPLVVSKWLLAGVGLAALVAGSALWALDGRPTCDLGPGQLRCPEVLDSAGAGIGLFVTGAVALGTSAVLFGVDYRRGEGPQVALVSLGGRF